MRKFGLIGFPLGHSFSKKYFDAKFETAGIKDCRFDLYEIPEVEEFEKIVGQNPGLEGLSVTIPYKQTVISFLDRLDPACEKIGAVNCIRVKDGIKTGYNTDYIGFKQSLLHWLGHQIPPALVLGTGGASKAVKQALTDLDVDFLSVSRNPASGLVTYDALAEDPSLMENYPLIINTTPLGTYPKTNEMADIPVSQLHSGHRVYDLVYNPAVTLLMQTCIDRGGKAKNGQDMLELQAEAAWKIWNS
ncbi:shikimate dehydrogenase family protein [Algoriphagus hitonicola]|uniref:Shikimate dehydrogenase n=1 Tax=Algoriphagus hitonicola TaxID=435880 RepID=A0A1I2QK39_9BACT|nr:shikimate dehydrogenase [Algoriphagus hitonicola]SFG28782.1 shikimate dehydrogenase [Algoriphagus hitonicola]